VALSGVAHPPEMPPDQGESVLQTAGFPLIKEAPLVSRVSRGLDRVEVIFDDENAVGVYIGLCEEEVHQQAGAAE